MKYSPMTSAKLPKTRVVNPCLGLKWSHSSARYHKMDNETQLLPFSPGFLLLFLAQGLMLHLLHINMHWCKPPTWNIQILSTIQILWQKFFIDPPTSLPAQSLRTPNPHLSSALSKDPGLLKHSQSKQLTPPSHWDVSVQRWLPNEPTI